MSEQRQALQQQLRQEFQKVYRERLLTMKDFYDNSYKTLQTSISNAYMKILKDQILTTMIGDKTTAPYIEDRVKELFIQIINNERELLIQKLGLQLTNMKFLNTKLKAELEKINEKNQNERKTIEMDKLSISQSLRKKNEQIYELKLEMQKKQSEIKQQLRIINQQKSEIFCLVQEKEELTNKLAYLNVETNSMVEKYKNKDLKEYQRKVKQLQRSHQQQLLIERKKYQKKISTYKNKIEEYKAKLIKMIEEQKSQNYSEINQKASVRDLEKKLLLITKESQKKIHQMRNHKEKDRLELEKKYEGRFKDLQEYYDKLLEQKINEAQKSALDAASRIKEEQDKIKQYIGYLEDNSQQSYQKVLAQNEQLKALFQNKLEEAGQQIEELMEDNERFEQLLRKSKAQQSEFQNHFTQSQSELIQARKKIECYEKELTKFSENCLQMEKNIKKLQNEIKKKEEELQNLQSTLSDNFNTLNSQERTINEMKKANSLLQQKLRNDFMSFEEQKKQYFDSEKKKNELTRNMAQKDHQIRQLTQHHQFQIQTLKNKIKKSNLQFNELKAQLDELNLKNKSLNEECLSLKKTNNEIQTIQQKVELQVKFYREAEKNIKEQHQAYRTQFHKKIEEKNALIEEYEKNENVLKKSLKTNETTLNQHKQVFQRKTKKLLQLAKKMRKYFIQQVDNFHRKLMDTKNYLLSFKNLFQNEKIICEKHIIMKISDFIRSFTGQYEESIRTIKKNCEQEKQKALCLLKAQIEKQQNHFKDRIQIEMKNYQTVTNSKDKQMQRLERQKKKLLSQKEDFVDQYHNLEKKFHEQEARWQNQKVLNKGKISQLIREFDNEKEKLIGFYDKQRSKQEEQIEELITTMKNVRKELDQTKNSYQNEKNELKATINQVSTNEREWKNKLNEREDELKKVGCSLRENSEINTKLEKELFEIKSQNQFLGQSIATFECDISRLTGQNVLYKQKSERLLEQKSEIERYYKREIEEKAEMQRIKQKAQMELRDIKMAMTKGNKVQELKALQQLDFETKELTSKVNQLKKINVMMNDKTPLRS